MNNLTSTTFSSVSASFGGLTIYSALRSINSDTKKKQISSALASLILFIAYFHYSKMTNLYNSDNIDNNKLLLIRYSDWIITVPLLIIELFILLNWIDVNDDGTLNITNYNEFYACIILSILMIVFGFVGEISENNKNIFFGLSMVSLILIGIIIYSLNNKLNEKSQNDWILFIFLFWIFYAVGFNKFIPNSNLLYNGLDLLTKGVFAFLAVTFI
jgi:bacteriorhodopsin